MQILFKLILKELPANMTRLLPYCLIGLLLISCKPANAPATFKPSATPTETATATPTIVWFPPTPTYTPRPTNTPAATPNEQRPIGDIILEDNFNRGNFWILSTQPFGSVALGKNEISLTVNEPKGYVYTFRQEPTLSDYYLITDANPTLCRDSDQYGLLLRSVSPSKFYRFALSCNGQARVDFVSGSTATSPQPWVQSASVPIGAPNHVTIEVLSSGDELSFWVNNQFQFTITDKILRQGLIGFFARSGGETAVTINFSNLRVYSLKDQ